MNDLAPPVWHPTTSPTLNINACAQASAQGVLHYQGCKWLMQTWTHELTFAWLSPVHLVAPIAQWLALHQEVADGHDGVTRSRHATVDPVSSKWLTPVRIMFERSYRASLNNGSLLCEPWTSCDHLPYQFCALAAVEDKLANAAICFRIFVRQARSHMYHAALLIALTRCSPLKRCFDRYSR